ncbi:MAG: hypothetical protein J5J00_01680 [Deltaproteobacteria bacterium]|nr:hypothetical protein [Deltaproteobacteria bacterium]
MITRILHVSGYRPVIDTVIEHQKRRGLQAAETASREMHSSSRLSLDAFAEALAQRNVDIFHIHDPTPLFSIADIDFTQSKLRDVRERGSKVVVSLDGDVPLPAIQDQEERQKLLDMLQEQLACIFICSAEWHSLLNGVDNWSWLPNPIDVKKVQAPEVYETPKEYSRVLHLTFGSSADESARIVPLLEELARKDKRFVLTVKPVEDLRSITELRELVSRHDVVVERVSRPMYGWVALEGMAAGKTVLSGIHPQHRQEWQQLEFSPVLDCNEQTLVRRLLSLAYEPRSMRDIGKRSRSFVETYHDADQIVAMMIEIYNQL